MNVALVVLSFLVGAVIAWATRPSRRPVAALPPPPPPPPQPAKEKQEEQEVGVEGEEGEETPLYAPYAVSRRDSPPPAAEGAFVSAPSLLPPASSAPPSPRAGRVPWEPDEARPDCTFCRARFSFARRRHHCRSCGLLVCGSCSRDRVRLPGHGSLPVRVCDGCRIASIASRKGEALPLQSIKAFALQSSPHPRAAEEEVRKRGEREEEDEELLRMSRLLSSDLLASLEAKPREEREEQEEQEQEEEEEEEEEGEEGGDESPGRRPVRRALFDEVPGQYRWRERLREAEALAERAAAAPEVLRQGELAVRRVAARPVDAFCVSAPLPEGAALERVAARLLELQDRLAWDRDLDPDGTAELRRFGDTASLQRHVTRPVGPVGARSFVVLCVRCDAEGEEEGEGQRQGRAVRLLQVGVAEPDLHDPRCTAGDQLPQLLTLERRAGRLWMSQTVHLQLGGWLPMSVVLAGMPALLANSCEQWLAHVARTCRPDDQ